MKLCVKFFLFAFLLGSGFCTFAQDLHPRLQSYVAALRQACCTPSGGEAFKTFSAFDLSTFPPEALEQLKNRANLNQMELRLISLGQARLSNAEVFEKVLSHLKNGEPDSLSRLRQASQRPIPDGVLFHVQKFPLELLHPDLQASVQANPELYKSVQTLAFAILEAAENRLEEGALGTRDLELQFEKRIASLRDSVEDSYLGRKSFRDVVSAAQPPTLGRLAPLPPRLNSEYLPAWEDLMLRTTQLTVKIPLVHLVAGFGQEASAASLCMVMEQMLAQMEMEKPDARGEWVIYLILDHFRDYPSATAARALSETLEFAQSKAAQFGQTLSSRLNSEQWQDVLASIEDPGSIAPLTQTLRKFKQNQE